MKLCGGRLVLSHEGGYSPVYVPFCGLAVMEELSGVKTAVNDPDGRPRRRRWAARICSRTRTRSSGEPSGARRSVMLRMRASSAEP